MKKINLYIEIVSSRSKDLSSMNEDSRKSALEVLSKKYSKVKITLVDTLDDLEKLVKRNPDLVFLGMKFIYEDSNLNTTDTNKKKIWLSEYFDRHGVCYTGSACKPHLLEFNKDQAKNAVSSAGLITADFCLIENGNKTNKKLLPSFPLFIKPTDQGGGSGIDNNSLVRNVTDLNSKVKSIYDELGSNSIAEEYLSGREYSIAILKNEENNDYLLMPLELVAPENNNGDRFLSSKIKQADTETFSIVSDEIVFSAITELAMDAFIALGARDYGRIDIRMDAYGVPHFLEANLIPSLLKDYGNFPKACFLNEDLDYENMIYKIVNLSLSRKIAYIKDEAIEPLVYVTQPLIAN
jgi:D-alanine-D-alanine ligase